MGPARYDYAPLRRCLGGLVTFLGGGRQMRAAAQTAEIDSRSEVNETRGERASGENVMYSWMRRELRGNGLYLQRVNICTSHAEIRVSGIFKANIIFRVNLRISNIEMYNFRLIDKLIENFIVHLLCNFRKSFYFKIKIHQIQSSLNFKKLQLDCHEMFKQKVFYGKSNFTICKNSLYSMNFKILNFTPLVNFI